MRTNAVGVCSVAAIAGALTVWYASRVTAPEIHARSVDSTSQTSGQWRSLGPAPLIYQGASPTNYHAGRVASIAVDPKNAAHWLAGFGNGGVWETHDAGATWVPITDDVPTLATGAVAFAPSDSNVVYVGTGESTGTAFAHVGVGILKSTDAGRTWALVGESEFARASVRRLLVDPGNPNHLAVASTRGGFGRDNREGAPAPPPFGVLKSTDGGVTWTRTLAGQVTALEVDPANFSRQYAAVADQRLGVQRDTPGAMPNGIYRSTDGGLTWSHVQGPWGNDPSPTRSTVGRIVLALAPSNPNVLYASIQIPPNGGSSATSLLGLFRTDNAWADEPSWIQVSTDATGSDNYCGPSKCGYSHVLAVDPQDANTLFAGAEEHGWRCRNCGASPVWTNVARNPDVHSDHHAYAWAGNRLIVGTDGGLWSTVDFGATWQNHNRALPTKMFYAADLHPTNPAMLLGGLRDHQLAVYSGNAGWRILPHASIWGEAEVAFSSSRPDTHWMGAHIWGVIRRTTDGGRTIVTVDDGIDKTGVAFVAPTTKCPANDDVFVTATNRMWRTDNFFTSPSPAWVANSPAHPYPTRGFNAQNEPETILSVAFVNGDRSCNSYAYGNRGGQVHLTRDGGTTWIDLDAARTLPARPINGLAFDPADPNRLFVAVSSYDEATPGKPGHIFLTQNAQAAAPSWTRLGPPDVPFANVPFNVIAIDPLNPRVIYTGSDNGLWQSTDGGTNWIKVGRESGLPPVSVYDIQIHPTTGRTVVFTYGRGAFELER